MRDVLRLVGVGAAIGFALVVMAGSTLRAVIVDVAPTDPAILLGAIAVLTVAAVCAHHLPHGVRARSIPRAC
jgi:hypothetical protein